LLPRRARALIPSPCKPLHDLNASLYIAPLDRQYACQNPIVGSRRDIAMTISRPSPTLHDVARLAGVSTATVSRCLNTPDKVVLSTRERVERAVQELGYAPNFGARAMASRRTNTIAAIIPTMENAIFAKGLQAFQEELHRHGFTLLVASSSYDPDIEAQQITTMVSRGADAILVIGHDRDPKIYEWLKRQNVPVVAAWTYTPATALASVGFDNCAAMKELCQRVIDLGHRDIAFVAPPVDDNDRARGRLRGITMAMDDAGLSPSRLSVVECPYGIDEGARAFRRLMADATPPSAIICGNDVLAVGAIKAAREMGIEVPAQVSITGFDGIELSLAVSPPLTTVNVPHQEMGRLAAEMLVEMLQSGQPGRNIRLATTIQPGGSLAPPP